MSVAKRSSLINQQGFTLLEVLVALLIFAVVGTAIMKAATDHLTGVSQIEEITFATWVANNRLTQLNIETPWPPKNNDRGSQEMAGRMWYWQQKVLKTQDEELLGIEIWVGTDETYEQTVTSVTSYLSKPAG